MYLHSIFFYHLSHVYLMPRINKIRIYNTVIAQSALKTTISGSVSIQRFILKNVSICKGHCNRKSTVIQERKKANEYKTRIHSYKNSR